MGILTANRNRAAGLRGRSLLLLLALLILGVALPALAGVDRVQVVNDASGSRLQVNGEDFIINGMNWDYIPIGDNYNYALWNQPEEVIREALHGEMLLLKNMGVNVIRQYVGVPPEWVQYIYETYGIYTVLNHPMGRYGVTIDGLYIPSTDYSDELTRASLKDEITGLVEQYRDTPGILMWLLGNENNYGLTWSSAETEALPEGERDTARARYLYSLYGEIIDAIHGIDDMRPVAIANGDVQYIDLIASEAGNLDIFGTNMYRGYSFRDAFEVVKEKLGVPIVFTEFGSDAFNAKTLSEDQQMQARYLISQWREIYANAAGHGLADNSIGGMTFQFSDGWWKFEQTSNLEVHDINASWPNDGYPDDFIPGENNMNEEWWGICAKGMPNSAGIYQLYPRAAYYALKQAHELNPYAPEVGLAEINAHFANINPLGATLEARSDKAALQTETLRRVRLSGLRVDMETYSTGGTNISTPDQPSSTSDTYPAFLGFDHMQSVYTTFEATPADNVTGYATLNILGNVPTNPIDEIFYENRGRPVTVQTTSGTKELTDVERVKLYQASIHWEDHWFNLDGFYRTGHYHWGYEGDFFGLYREANYGENIDIYNGEAPVGFEVAGKRALNNLVLAFGPQLWWGANPAVLAKYQYDIGPVLASAVYQRDLEQRDAAVSSIAIPSPSTEKVTLALETEKGPFGIQIGGIVGGRERIGDSFQFVEGSSGNYTVLQDEIKDTDTFGGKVKFTFSYGRWNWYLQAASMGLVADGGPTAVQTFTGWRLADSGSGNQNNVITGFTYMIGNWTIAPNFLWQKPIVGPIPGDVPTPGRPRNILDDAFAVRANRETTAGEILLTYDPTPATWMYDWDNDLREDAAFAGNLGFVFKHHPTTQDAAIGILEDGVTSFAFPGATPARDLWEVYSRMVSKAWPGFGLVTNVFVGTGEPNGNDPRLVERYGGDVRLILDSFKFIASAKVNDWGPYDYHKDFNLTYPLQLVGDVSTFVGMPEWFDEPQTRFGVRVTWRSLDQYSPRYCPATIVDASGNVTCDTETPGLSQGSEWEIRTYLSLTIGN